MANEEQTPTIMSTEQTPDEERNIAIAKEYMSIAYSPTKNTDGDSVKHLCHSDAWFWSPSTFSGCKTLMDYAQSHSFVMASVKNSHVLLRYTASGSHYGKPYKGIEKTAIFEVEEGKKVMQIQLGWAPVKESEDPRWNEEMLRDPDRGREVKE
ncbi:hypothetical protein K458DRAFT_441610 [Lentithecium fluviatile CBS 122367]|uniref:NTF2-like protein n=1 Tax=Lentithecium fluviatile CBS 122367 TaxID=1168545 RepID=A0A6G1J9M9_9PLEO|nr:hypothetical protein K458DRAFT_441610 [Lentithecium fluviatile CBS 122367]